MATSTLSRDFDIGRIIADYERRISFLERRLLRLAYLTPEFTAVQACKVTRDSVQSIPNSSFTTLQFNDEVFDDTDMHDNAVNNSRITIAVPGYYVMGANIEMESAADYTRFILAIRLNGATEIVRIQVNPISGNVPQRFEEAMMHQLVAGDYLEARLFQTNGAAASRNVEVVDYSPIFYAARIGS